VAQTTLQADGIAILRAIGSVRRIQILEPGCIYIHGIPPTVVVSPPGRRGRAAAGRAVLDGKGGVREVILTDKGSGYTDGDIVTVQFIARGPGEMDMEQRIELGVEEPEPASCRGPARAAALLDREVDRIELLEGGAGYVKQIGANVTIDPPVLCGGELDGEAATAVAELSPVERRKTGPPDMTYTPSSLSSQLGQLLPPGVALGYNPLRGQYVVLAKELDLMRGTSTMMDPIFGPVGKSPLERESKLSLDDYLRLALSGGICIMMVRTGLTPLEIVKTRLQVRPDLYRGWSDGITKIREEGGKNPFFKGFDCTALVSFILGALGFGFKEYFRRLLEDWVGKGASEVFSIPIILAASAMATVISACLTCPIEAVRIRIMSTPGDIELLGFVRIGRDLVRQGGVMSLYDGLEPLLFREVPFISKSLPAPRPPHTNPCPCTGVHIWTDFHCYMSTDHPLQATI
jgi:hypothetical protein